MPYVAHVEEYTILSMPAACAARSQRYPSYDIVVIVAAGIPNRLANLNRRGKMYDRERFVFPEHLIEFAAIPDVAYLKWSPFDKFSMTI
jgi:hypothetical protein